MSATVRHRSEALRSAPWDPEQRRPRNLGTDARDPAPMRRGALLWHVDRPDEEGSWRTADATLEARARREFKRHADLGRAVRLRDPDGVVVRCFGIIDGNPRRSGTEFEEAAC